MGGDVSDYVIRQNDVSGSGVPWGAGRTHIGQVKTSKDQRLYSNLKGSGFR